MIRLHTYRASSFFFLILITPYAYCDDFISQELDEDVNFLETSLPEAAREATPEDAVAPIITIDGHKILEVDLFCHTNPLNKRNILDSPIMLPQKPGYYRYPRIFGAQLFWSKTDKMFFTKNSGSICSYLAILDPNLIQAIDNSISKIQKLDPTFNINPTNILPLFKDARIEERKLGFMFHGARHWRRTHFRAMVPLYYYERNFFLTDEERDDIEQELGSSEGEDQMEFAEDHLISDQLGFGDTRLMLDFNAIESKHGFEAMVGIFTTLPTACAFKKGLKGTHFKKCSKMPVFSFQELFEEGQTVEQITEQVQKFLLGVVDHLSANILDTQLGSDKHIGFGGEWRSETPLRIFIRKRWADNIYMKSFLSLEYYFPANEKRFFIDCNTAAQFDALGLNRDSNTILENLTDPVYAQQVLDFLQAKFVESLYPFVAQTRVQPGVIFRWCSKAFYVKEHWGFNLGTDMWIQSPEKIRSVSTCGIPTKLNIRKGIKPYGYQNKVVGALFYTWTGDRDLTLGLNADSTYSSTGIGQDFTVSLNLETNF